MSTKIVIALGALVVVMATSAAGAAETSGDVDSGRDIFAANCAMCHGQDAAGMMGMHPSLRGAVDRLTIEGVEVTVRNGRDTNPPMPAFGDRLSERQMADLVAYIDSLPRGPRNFGPGSDGGGMMGDGMMDGAMWIWPLVTVLILGGIVAAVVVAVRRAAGRSRIGSARDVLDRRYAEGRISREEYLRARADLDGDDGGPQRR